MQLQEKVGPLMNLGPFEQAKTNIEKFAWNYMILYTTVIVMKALQQIEDIDSAEATLTREMAEATLQGLFELVRTRDGDMWN